jgi:hypothetical protein
VGIGSADTEHGALRGPVQWQVARHQRAMIERRGLTPLDDGGDDVRCEIADDSEFGQPSATTIGVGRDAGKRQVRLAKRESRAVTNRERCPPSPRPDDYDNIIRWLMSVSFATLRRERERIVRLF